MEKKSKETKAEVKAEIKTTVVSDELLSSLATAEAVGTLNKEPLEMAEGEVLRCVLSNKYERELNNGKKARYVVLMDANRKQSFSASTQLVNALFDMDLHTAVEITYKGTETTENGNELKLFDVKLLNA